MRFDPVSLLSKRFSVRSLILAIIFSFYIAASFVVYFEWIAPSLQGKTDQHIAADSSTYMYFAQSLRSGSPDPLVIASLASFPNTLWSPVLIALALPNPLAIVIADYAMFFVSLWLLIKGVRPSMSRFLTFMILNATTTISLLSVNKEIIDLLVTCTFLYGYSRRRLVVIALALGVALLNRFEVCAVMLLFLVLQSRLNPVRQRRGLSLFLIAVALSVILPLSASANLSVRFAEASAGGVVKLLDQLEMHYLFVVSVIPKIGENLFGMLISPGSWAKFSDFSDLANSYILFLNNLATAVVLLVLAERRKLSLDSDIMYFAALGCIVMSMSLVIQPRYFYFVYVLFCVEASLPKSHGAIPGSANTAVRKSAYA